MARLRIFLSSLPSVSVPDEREPGEKEGDFVGAAAFEVVEGVDAGFADDGHVLSPGGDIGSGKREPGIVGEGCAEPFAAQVIAVAEQSGKGDLAAATAFEGAVARVVLEKHLLDVCKFHSLTIQKKHPTINDLNDLLKEAGVVDVPTWRPIQQLAGLRNQCVHGREPEPTSDQVDELIAGVNRIIHNVF